MQAIVLSNLGGASRALGEYQPAVACYLDGLAILRTIGDQRWIAASLNGLGLTLLDMGDDVAAQGRAREALDLALAMRSVPDMLDSIAVLGQILAKSDLTREQGLAALGFAAAHAVTSAITRRRSAVVIEQLKDQMAERAWQAAVARGKRQTIDDVASDLLRLFPLDRSPIDKVLTIATDNR
jgi:hypothetical protein